MDKAIYKDVKVTYDGTSRISVKGENLRIVLTISQGELMKVYMKEEGTAKVLVSIQE